MSLDINIYLIYLLSKALFYYIYKVTGLYKKILYIA